MSDVEMMVNSDNEDHQVGHGPVDISDDEGWKPIDNVGMEVQTSFLEDGDLKPETNTVGMQTEKVKRDAPEKTAYTDVELGKRTWANAMGRYIVNGTLHPDTRDMRQRAAKHLMESLETVWEYDDDFQTFAYAAKSEALDKLMELTQKFMKDEKAKYIRARNEFFQYKTVAQDMDKKRKALVDSVEPVNDIAKKICSMAGIPPLEAVELK